LIFIFFKNILKYLNTYLSNLKINIIGPRFDLKVFRYLGTYLLFDEFILLIKQLAKYDHSIKRKVFHLELVAYLYGKIKVWQSF